MQYDSCLYCYYIIWNCQLNNNMILYIVSGLVHLSLAKLFLPDKKYQKQARYIRLSKTILMYYFVSKWEHEAIFCSACQGQSLSIYNCERSRTILRSKIIKSIWIWKSMLAMYKHEHSTTLKQITTKDYRFAWLYIYDMCAQNEDVFLESAFLCLYFFVLHSISEN